MDKSNQDWMVRNLHVLLTAEKACGNKIEDRCNIASIRLARETLNYNDEESFWEHMANSLLAMASERPDPTFWSVFGLLLRRNPVKHVEKLDFFIANVRNLQSPYTIKQVLKAFSNFVNVAQNPWRLGNAYLPLKARPLEERRSEWIKNGPLFLSRKSYCSLDEGVAEFSKTLSADVSIR
jgi:hypothetical protein